MSLSSDGKTIYPDHLTITFGYGICRMRMHSNPCRYSEGVAYVSLSSDGKPFIPDQLTIHSGLGSEERTVSKPGQSLRGSLIHEAVERGKTIYSGSFDNTIGVKNLENGECVKNLAGHFGLVSCMSL
jgi:WD40 repeat protein